MLTLLYYYKKNKYDSSYGNVGNNKYIDGNYAQTANVPPKIQSFWLSDRNGNNVDLCSDLHHCIFLNQSQVSSYVQHPLSLFLYLSSPSPCHGVSFCLSVFSFFVLPRSPLPWLWAEPPLAAIQQSSCRNGWRKDRRRKDRRGKEETRAQDLACGEAEKARKARDTSRSNEGRNVKDRAKERKKLSKPSLQFLCIPTSWLRTSVLQCKAKIWFCS